ncbi:hypothetical protein CO174_05335 [Candidatus Uhrbacteria bacterium CG_4_9_14_3_um_filter_50_9]|uniref:Uncharacterized protein n=1 Tax=Candidatus Uhrbacteria bacterium CG_4_9_14_3_um_filter_50_9 TaxID=1975035 RepID=A0A2M7XAX1_9BACT|nr:MAG: hypothetical protein CO174_05335 [Candidatus Uhrbacteria bacterium CG_4_9_14_3_um_filter_50_9]
MEDQRQRHRPPRQRTDRQAGGGDDSEYERLFKEQERSKLLKLALFEIFFVTVILPITVLVTGIEVVIGTLGLVTYPVRGKQAFGPWYRIRDMWELCWRHVKYVTRYATVPKFRREVEALRSSVETRINDLQMGARVRRVGESLVAPFEYVDPEVLTAVFIQLLPFAIFVPHMIVATAGLLATWNVWTYYDVAQPLVEPPPAVVVEYQPQIADQQEANFGPWLTRGQVISQVNESSFQNLALIDSTGGIKYSEVHVGSLEGFAPRVTEKIVNPRVNDNGTISFKDQRGSELTVNPGQIFLFENYKSYAFAFTSDGKVLAIRQSILITTEISR